MHNAFTYPLHYICCIVREIKKTSTIISHDLSLPEAKVLRKPFELCFIVHEISYIFMCFSLHYIHNVSLNIYLFADNEETMFKKAYKWLCGLDVNGSQNTVNAEQEQEERIKKLSSLKQDPRTSLILNINLGIIFSVGLFLYIYFTFHRA